MWHTASSTQGSSGRADFSAIDLGSLGCRFSQQILDRLKDLKGQLLKEKGGQKADELGELPQLNRNAAGIDVDSAAHYVAVPAGRDAEPVQEFGSLTADLHRMAKWLKACQVDTCPWTELHRYAKSTISATCGNDVKRR
jgi:hypothetical protein